MARHKADARDAALRRTMQHLGKAGLAVEVAAVAVDVLSQQRDLHHALFGELSELSADVFQRATLLATAHVGHDAVGAEVVAAGHDGHPGAPGASAGCRQVAGKAVVGLDGLDHRGARLQALLQQLHQMAQVVGAEDDVHVRKALAQLLAVALADAATHAHQARLALVGRWDVLEARHLAHEADVCGLAHAAGDEDDDVCRLDGVDHHAALGVEHAGHALSVVFVHLAAEDLEAVGHASQQVGVLHA